MTRRLTIMAVLLALVVGGSTSLVASAADDDVWFCSSDDTVGWLKKDGRWETSRFQLEKFKMKFGKEIGDWTSITMSSELRRDYNYSCKTNGLLAISLRVECLETMGGYFTINRKTGNYVLVDSFGWIRDTAKKKTNDTVSIQRGTCTKF